MEIKFSGSLASSKGALVFLIMEDLKLGATLSSIDKQSGGLVAKTIKSSSFNGKRGKLVSLTAPSAIKADYIVLIGSGNAKEQTKEVDLQALGGSVSAYLNGIRVKEASLVVENKIGKYSLAEVAANIGLGALLKSYRFDKYFTRKKEDEKPSLQSLSIECKDPGSAKKLFDNIKAIAEGVFLARDVVSEPPNVIYPATLAQRCQELTKHGVKVEVLNVQQMKKLGMGALLGVAQGSVQEGKLVVMQWNGNPSAKNKKPLAFIGKGVTFDTGGISLKPANGMEDMKYDMGGSAAVIGLMKTLSVRKARVNAVGVVGLVENMPDGNAQRPSDVVTSMSGQTIEVLNTDAEGRLVLADALWYCQDRFNPQFMVNLATLTGAITVALGAQYAGLFSNNDALCEKLVKAGEKTGEKLWRFPMGDAYDKQINSEIADMQNIGNEKGAGSITAAQFLQRFVNNVPWAHLDIAGVAWTKKDMDITPKGATAFGVRLLNQLVKDFYEGK